MENKRLNFTKSELIAISSGLLVFLLGFTVLIGWFFNSQVLTQISPSFAPMQFTTAFCFLCLGAAIISVGLGKPLVSKIFLALFTSVTLLTLLEYVTGFSTGLDNLFVDPITIQTKTLHPGRMSPPTTFCFLFSALGIGMLHFKKFPRRFSIAMGLIASIVFALAISTVFGYFLNFETAQVKLSLLGMALHTATGFVLASLGIFSFSISKEQGRKNTLPRWVAVPVAIVVMCIAVIMWQSLLTQEFNNLKQFVHLQNLSNKHILEEKLILHFNTLQRMANRIENFKSMSDEEIRSDATQYVRHFESYYALVHFDSKLNLSTEVLSDPAAENIPRLSMDELVTLRSKSKKDSQFVYARNVNNDTSPDLFLVVPLYKKEEFDGFVGVIVDADTFLDFGISINPEIEYAVSLTSELVVEELYGTCCSDVKESLISRLEFSDSRGNWTIQTWPTEKLISMQATVLPQVVLFGGLLLSIFSLLVIHFGITAQLRSLELLETNDSLEVKVNLRTKELKERDEFTRNWLNNTTDGAFDWDVKNSTVIMSKQFGALLGYEVSEIGNNTESWRTLLLPADIPIADKTRIEHIEQGKPYASQLRFRHKNGSIITTLVRGEGIKNADGETIRIIGTLTDITQLKRLEENLKNSNRELEQFAYVASHDLQEPLRTVGSFVQLLEQRYKDKLDERAGEYIQFAVDGVTRMRQLINDLLTFSRVETKRGRIEPVDLEMLISATKANLKIALEENDVILTSDTLPTVMADKAQFSQVFHNLIGNAIKFRGENQPNIHIGAEKRSGEWLFSIRDNGIGIEQDFSEKIFIIFQRLHTRSEYPGTGIGLSLCKKIIERHGGTIWVESNTGSGSIFYFTIPDVIGEQYEYDSREQSNSNLVS